VARYPAVIAVAPDRSNRFSRQWERGCHVHVP